MAEPLDLEAIEKQFLARQLPTWAQLAALIAEVRALRAEIERLREALTALVETHGSAHQDDDLLRRRLTSIEEQRDWCDYGDVPAMLALLNGRAALRPLPAGPEGK